MKYTSHFFEDLKVQVHIASFDNEHYVSAEIAANSGSAAQQKTPLEKALLTAQPPNTELVCKRYFVSDAINQKYLFEHDDIFSVIQQPPLNGSKISVIAYFVSKTDSVISYIPNNTTLFIRPNYKHLFVGQIFCHEGNTFEQTKCVFENYIRYLNQQELSLADNTIRTWIYVKDLDNCYSDMVAARNEIFAHNGLVKHFLASTGIEGHGIHFRTRVTMDTYAVNVRPDQITFLKAETHLNPTCEYGVSFERATAVDYADRRHIFVSGTASIDNKGKVVAFGDIKRQLERTLENINALLKEGNAAMSDITHFIIYLRDSGDYAFVKNYFDANFADIPRVIVHAAVCRSGWLIEIECIAIAKQQQQNSKWLPF
ncbi:MAG: hypothetical protein LBC49_04245 [Bacteroidales bacterium]|jgi:enamine deaminase RidA (YjgF/YER057c/UK114 family)|nr:hypothetical protein [Bacteroidales bacterium]